MANTPRSSSGRRPPESDPAETVTITREEVAIEGELAEATVVEAEMRLEERDECPWPPDLSPEWIGAAGKLFRLAVLDRYGVFRVAVQICAKVASGDGSIVPRDAEVACRAYELNQLLAADPSPAALNYASHGYNQLLPPLRAYARALCTIANFLPVTADELDVPMAVAYSAWDARFRLQVAASRVGRGIAGCVAGEVDPVAEACIELLSNPSLLCAAGVYDTTELFNQYNGSKSYNDVCRLLCGSKRLLFDAAAQLPSDACSTDYQIDDEVVRAGMMFNGGDESVNPGVTGSLPARPAAAGQFRWAGAIATMRRTTAIPAPTSRFRLTANL